MNFSGIIGHQRELNYLAFLAGSDEIPHAFLFTGEEGIGKRMIAERFLSSFFCNVSDAPCLKCGPCTQISAGIFPDLIVLGKDEKGSIPIGGREKPQPGSVRWVIEKLSMTSLTGNSCVIIDGADAISDAGQNALLKTIEEPNSRTYIVLISRSSYGLLPTILSRCIAVQFKSLSEDEISEIVSERLKPSSVSQLVLEISGGSAGMALKLHEESVFDEILELCRNIAEFTKNRNNRLFNYSVISKSIDNELLLTVLINIYSYMIRQNYITGEASLPDEIILNKDDSIRIMKVLLAMKRGTGKNLNMKNIFKGLVYSLSDINFNRLQEPDFSWIEYS